MRGKIRNPSSGGPRPRFYLCADCGYFYLVKEHTCPEKHHTAVVGKASARGMGKASKKRGRTQ